MAVVTVNSNYGFDIRGLDFSSLYDGVYYTATPTVFVVDYGTGYKDEFRGSGFTYNAYLEPTGGTVSSYAATYFGTRLAFVDGIRISAVSIGAAAKTYSLSDDYAVVRAALAGNDTFNGGNLNDYLIGYGGNDTMRGNGGHDTLIGDLGHDTLIGAAGADRLIGSYGVDSHYGGIGNDAMTGGAGNDRFLFDSSPNTSTNRDLVTDFVHGGDKFWMQDAIFTHLGVAGHLLNPAFLRTGAAALDANDYIVYNRVTGALSYDADGNGAGAAVQFAIVSNKPVLSNTDFFVF